MSVLADAWNYAIARPEELRTALGEHLWLVAVPLGAGGVAGVSVGVASTRSRWVSLVALNGLNGLRAIPSIAVLFVAIPYLGLSFQAAAVAIWLLVVPPIALATEAALRALDADLLEAARGMGMSPQQVWWQVEVPLALPQVVAGVKTAAVEAIASATLAAFIGAGGLGSFVVLGFALYDSAVLLVGAVPVALLALGAELGLSGLQRLLRPPVR